LIISGGYFVISFKQLLSPIGGVIGIVLTAATNIWPSAAGGGNNW
jgi:hypothetical protein